MPTTSSILLDNPAATIYDLGDRILFWKYKTNHYVELDELLDMIAVSKNHAERVGKCYFIVEAPATMNFNVDTWQFVSTTNYEDGVVMATAMYTTGIQHTLMAKPYERKVTPQSLFRVCSDFDASMTWIRSLIAAE